MGTSGSQKNSSSFIRAQQQEWARKAHVSVDDKGYTELLSHNLFQPLCEASIWEINAADGNELFSKSGRAKMHALHSSSALACNFFEFWRERDARPLAASLDIPGSLCGISFERKFPTGIGPKSPNLDVVIECSDDGLTAIESKFCEPYAGAERKRIAAKYFPSGDGPWSKLGFANCQTLAEQLQEGQATVFQFLDAPQLLKHILGIAQAGKPWRLICLWFDSGRLDAKQHADELKIFSTTCAADGIRFDAMSYQALFSKLRTLVAKDDQAYMRYLESRYFPTEMIGQARLSKT